MELEAVFSPFSPAQLHSIACLRPKRYPRLIGPLFSEYNRRSFKQHNQSDGDEMSSPIGHKTNDPGN